MASCGLCGGLGRIGPGGIIGLFGPAGGVGVHACGLCRGTGLVSDADTGPVVELPSQLRGPDPTGLLSGEWLVEVHGSGRILAVLRFLLEGERTARRFEARCDFGGLPGWTATGEWLALGVGNVIRFAGSQCTPYVPATGYHWGATLDPLGGNVLHGESIAEEWTMWSRQPNQTLHSGWSAAGGSRRLLW